MATQKPQTKRGSERKAQPARKTNAAHGKAVKLARAAEGSASQPIPIGREALLDAAVRQFAQKGYDKTSMRDIASSAGMLAGSIYYYFPTKEQLFLAVHEHAVLHNCDRVRAAIDPAADAWTRLTQAAEGYLDCMLNEFEYASIIITEFPQRRAPELRDTLIAHRKIFEDIFVGIVKELPLRRGVDRSYLRLAILGMLAWCYTWYTPDGRDTPRVIAQKMINLVRDSTQPG